MAIRKIAQLGEPVLRTPARPLRPEEIQGSFTRALIADMIETMRDADGAGLAAPQVYEPYRLCVIELKNNPRYPDLEPVPLTTLINPIITPLLDDPAGVLRDHEAMIVYEGCLSVPGLRGRVRRPRKVRVQALDAEARPLDFVWEGFRAAVVQHEVDHLDATLFVDRAEARTLTYLREYERFVPAEARVIDGASLRASAR
jgi:peptide deformylase